MPRQPREINIKSTVEPIKKTWLNAEEAVAYLGCSERFLRQLKDKAEIRAAKYGNKLWYEVKSIDRFFDRHKAF